MVMAHMWRRNAADESHSGVLVDSSGDVYGIAGDPYYHESWWWTDAGMAVRYTLICLIFSIILFYFLGGYWHARRRLSKGLQPLAYHRWMVHRTVRYGRSQGAPHYQQDPYQEGYVMHGYAPPPNPPPAYQRDAPPAYEPPQGASKAMADQNYRAHARPEDGNAGESSTPVASGARQ